MCQFNEHVQWTRTSTPYTHTHTPDRNNSNITTDNWRWFNHFCLKIDYCGVTVTACCSQLQLITGDHVAVGHNILSFGGPTFRADVDRQTAGHVAPHMAD